MSVLQSLLSIATLWKTAPATFVFIAITTTPDTPPPARNGKWNVALRCSAKEGSRRRKTEI
jgi:hypothetical protein